MNIGIINIIKDKIKDTQEDMEKDLKLQKEESKHNDHHLTQGVIWRNTMCDSEVPFTFYSYSN